MFLLYAIIELLKRKKEKLYCAFIDLKKAFDTIWRVGLWSKLLKYNIDGKFFRIIYSMYNGIKSCVRKDGELSQYFGCDIGVRQGENLSPLLFSLFLNDLEDYLKLCQCKGITINAFDFDIYIDIGLTLFVMLYADDTALLTRNEEDLQNMLNAYNSYCKTWKLTVNVSKTKIIIFGGTKKDYKKVFYLDSFEIENVNEYKYLGIWFEKSNKFTLCKKHLAQQARKAMFYILQKSNEYCLSIEYRLKLFDAIVVPILLYGCEIWGFENINILENVHIQFLRYLAHVRKSTPVYMLYGEFGRKPLLLTISLRIICFWARLLTGKTSKLSVQIYQLLFYDYTYCGTQHKWIIHVRDIFYKLGLNNIWDKQMFNSITRLKALVKQRLSDQFLQNWQSDISKSNKGLTYRIFKDSLVFETYFNILDKSLSNIFLRFRIANHFLPIETGRWSNILYQNRKCIYCDTNDVGDEFHYLFICTKCSEERHKYIHKYYINKPNVYKFKQLFNCKKIGTLKQLCKFIIIINKQFCSS